MADEKSVSASPLDNLQTAKSLREAGNKAFKAKNWKEVNASNSYGILSSLLFLEKKLLANNTYFRCNIVHPVRTVLLCLISGFFYFHPFSERISQPPCYLLTCELPFASHPYRINLLIDMCMNAPGSRSLRIKRPVNRIAQSFCFANSFSVGPCARLL